MPPFAAVDGTAYPVVGEMTKVALHWGRKATWHVLFALLFVLGAAWIALNRIPASAGDDPQALPRKGFVAPDFTLEALDGQTIVLSELRGEVVLINFWATWCPPCREEMPAMQKVYEQYRDQGFQVLAISLDVQHAQVPAFVEEKGLTYPVMMDRDGTVSDLYQILSLPTTFFVDRSGVIQKIIIGGPMPHALIESIVTEFLAEGDEA